MTIKSKIKSMLVNHGLFEDMADKIMQKIIDDPANAVMAGRWEDDADGYPTMLMAILWSSAKREALSFIDAECPQHWARAVFAE